jgi:peptidoglycan/LPS O-acetylase OafA/YrhL
LFEVFVQLLLELGVESIGQSLRPRRKAKPLVAGLGLLLLGSLVGLASGFAVPFRLSPTTRFSGTSLVLAPIAGGVAMQAMGAWRSSRGHEPSSLATWWGGALFALAMAAVRLAMVG